MKNPFHNKLIKSYGIINPSPAAKATKRVMIKFLCRFFIRDDTALKLHFFTGFKYLIYLILFLFLFQNFFIISYFANFVGLLRVVLMGIIGFAIYLFISKVYYNLFVRLFLSWFIFYVLIIVASWTLERGIVILSDLFLVIQWNGIDIDEPYNISNNSNNNDSSNNNSYYNSYYNSENNNYNSNSFMDTVVGNGDKGLEVSDKGVDRVIDNKNSIAVANSAGAIGAAFCKGTADVNMYIRLLATWSAMLIGAASTAIGYEQGNSHMVGIQSAEVKPLEKLVEVDLETTYINKVGVLMIKSPLELNEVYNSLLSIIENMVIRDILDLFMILILIFVFINKKIRDKVSFKIDNYIPRKYIRTHQIIGKIKNNIDNIDFIVISTILIGLLLNKILSIYIGVQLSEGLDDLVYLYNEATNNSGIILLWSRGKINNLFTLAQGQKAEGGSTRRVPYKRCLSNINYNNIETINIDEDIELYGNYENYYQHKLELNNKEVTLDFLIKNYPDYQSDETFILFLNKLPTEVIDEVESVVKIYKEINELNALNHQLLMSAEILPERLARKILSELKNKRKEVIELLKGIRIANIESTLDSLIFKINLKLKNKVFLEETVLKHKNRLKKEQDFSDNWRIIKDLIFTDVKNSLMIYEDDNIKITDLDPADLNKINELEDLFLNIFTLNSFISEQGINRTESDKKYINRYLEEFTKFGNSAKIETYKTKKGETRTKQMRKGLIINGYKEILTKMKEELEKLINNYYSSNSEDKTNKFVEGTSILYNKLNEAQEIRNKDYRLIYNKITKAFNIYDIIFNISKNLNEENISEHYQKFISYYRDSIKGYTHDELYQLYVSINKIKQIEFNKLIPFKGKVSNLSLNSYLFLKCKEILQYKISAQQKQLLLEQFILSYEKGYTENLIRNMNNTVQDYKLLTRIYKHSTPQFEERIKIFIENNKKKNYAIYFKNRENISKLGEILVLALFLTIDSNQLINIIFSKVVRLIGQSGGVTQNELLGSLTEEMLIVFKYNLKKLDASTLNNYNQEEQEIIMLIKNKFNELPIETKYKFGDLLLELILDEFKYIFTKNSIFNKNEHHIYISITPEYLAILTGSIFNPVRLPMINPPKDWLCQIDKETNKVSKITQVGGYYFDEYNELNKNNKLIRDNNYNKFESLISGEQINTINFLNSKAFEVNKDTLNFIVKEWGNKEDSTIFRGFNQLHPLTDNYDKVNSAIKKEILAHNSKYWSNTNVINIALLFQYETLYFPTFFDFRGRIYPAPNYLSYQSSDLARSLLVFKDIPKNICTSNPTSRETSNTNNYYLDILINILQTETYNNNSISNKKKVLDSKLNDIDYFKLYLANTFGKDKLTRRGKLKWVNKNIDQIINEYENDLDTFKKNYLLKSKEPFQFLSCILAYIKYIKTNKEIKLPILFDASCSGVQHLSALTTETKIAKLVNLLNNDSPSDFYQYCIDELIQVIYLIPEDGKLVELKQKLLKLEITRKWLKNSIMTIPYNVTEIGIVNKLETKFERYLISVADLNKLQNGELSLIELIEDFKENKLNSSRQKSSTADNKTQSKKENKSHYIFVPVIDILKNKNEDTLFFTSSDLINLAKLLKTTVLNIIPPFNQLKIYFDKIIDIFDKLDLPLYWDTPTGMYVSMSNRIMNSKQIKTNLLKKSKPITILIPTDQIDYKNIKTGMMPNFIHSLDASNIHKLVNNLKLFGLEHLNLYTIHDCFASDYKNIALIEFLVKHSFIELYFKNNYLEFVHETFLRQISQKNDIYTKTTPWPGPGAQAKIENLEVEVKYIMIPNSKSSLNNQIETIYLPELPKYNWSINKEIIKNELLLSSYFIS